MVLNSEIAVSFLTHVFRDDFQIVATIRMAQLEDKPEIIIDALESVGEFCDKLIKEIRDGNN